MLSQVADRCPTATYVLRNAMDDAVGPIRRSFLVPQTRADAIRRTDVSGVASHHVFARGSGFPSAS
jgi:hypothetical protein